MHTMSEERRARNQDMIPLKITWSQTSNIWSRWAAGCLAGRFMYFICFQKFEHLDDEKKTRAIQNVFNWFKAQTTCHGSW